MSSAIPLQIQSKCLADQSTRDFDMLSGWLLLPQLFQLGERSLVTVNCVV